MTVQSPTHLSVSTFPHDIFRAYDIRGKVEKINQDVIHAIGCALARLYVSLKQRKIVVGYDARLSSEGYADIISDTLLKQGLEVICIGRVSSPLLYFTALQFEGNGIMITASHNPICDNGIKWLVKGQPPCPEHIQQLAQATKESLINDQLTDSAPFQQKLKPQYIDASVAYRAFMRQEFAYFEQITATQSDILSQTICVEGLHGSAGEIAAQILKDLGFTVYTLNCEANGHFPFGAPDPSDAKRLQSLCEAVKQQHAVLGIALDGDGDRLVVVDDLGQIVSPDILLCLFAKMCLVAQPASEIVCDVKCSSQLAYTVNHYQGKLTMIRTGSSFLRNYLHETKAVFGGEFAGHYVFNDGRGKGFDDGLYAALRVIEYVFQSKQVLSQIVQEFGQRVASEDIYLCCEGQDIEAIVACIQDYAAHHPAVSICRVDGIRLDFPFGFGLIRASNTGDHFTVRFDAHHASQLIEIADYFYQALQQDYASLAQQIEHIVASFKCTSHSTV